MVKIEKVLDGAIATVTRGDQEVQLFQGQLINYLDLDTLKVVGGKLIYSVDETEVIEVVGVPAVAGGPVAQEVAAIVEETASVTDEVTIAPAKPATKTAAKKK